MGFLFYKFCADDDRTVKNLLHRIVEVKYMYVTFKQNFDEKCRMQNIFCPKTANKLEIIFVNKRWMIFSKNYEKHCRKWSAIFVVFSFNR